jgi:hypothetical protein
LSQTFLLRLLSSSFLSSWCLPVPGWTILFCHPISISVLNFNSDALLSILNIFTSHILVMFSRLTPRHLCSIMLFIWLVTYFSIRSVIWS